MSNSTRPIFEKGQSLNRRFMPTDVFYTIKSIKFDYWCNEYVYSCDVVGPHGYKSKSKSLESQLFHN